tara:strand:+ start:426 stop:650 length:225 start_codon:yes stop_codon:yes gene_type:complete
MSLEASFKLLNIRIPESVKNYPPEKQQEVLEYLQEMDCIHKKAYEIALNHLESSFDILRSNGFQEWQKAKVSSS